MIPDVAEEVELADDVFNTFLPAMFLDLPAFIDLVVSMFVSELRSVGSIRSSHVPGFLSKCSESSKTFEVKSAAY